MKRRRRNDPLGVSGHPLIANDPGVQAEIAAEFRRKVAYLDRHFEIETKAGFGSREFNASLRLLRTQLQKPAKPGALQRRLHPWLELLINLKAKQLADLRPDQALDAEHAGFVQEAASFIAKSVTAIRGTPGDAAVRRYLEGLMAAMQEATGKPVMAMRDKEHVYDPQLPGPSGKLIRLLVDRLQPGVTDSKLSYWVRQARLRFAGRAMRFRDLFPGYGSSVDGGVVAIPGHRIDSFEMLQPIYCPSAGPARPIADLLPVEESSHELPVEPAAG